MQTLLAPGGGGSTGQDRRGPQMNRQTRWEETCPGNVAHKHPVNKFTPCPPGPLQASRALVHHPCSAGSGPLRGITALIENRAEEQARPMVRGQRRGAGPFVFGGLGGPGKNGTN